MPAVLTLSGALMTAIDQRRDAAVSIRLDQVLRVYAYKLDPRTLADLRTALESGRHPWLHDEFAQVIADGAYALRKWCAAIGTAVEDSPIPPAPLADQQLAVWQLLFPGEPFPSASAAGGKE